MNTNSNKATVIANHTLQGISVVGIDIYVTRRDLHMLASKRFIDQVNAIPFLDEDKIKTEVVKKFRISRKNISFQ